MNHPQIARATSEARERVVETVVSAFASDPAFRFFFADETTFDEQATAFAGYLFDKRVKHGTVWIIDDAAAVAMWDAPRTSEDASANDYQLDLPDGTLKRLDRYDAVVHGALPSSPHWYLGILATHPDHAGRGWGRLVMTAGLDRAAAAGQPAYLETTNENNVALYQRAGWQVTETLAVDDLPIWVMRHG